MLKFFRYFFCSFCVFLSLNSNAQWSKLSLEGGIVRNVVQTDSFLFLLNFEGVYKSPINSISWTKINSTLFSNKINFNTYDVRIATSGNSIYLFNENLTLLESNDQGLNWTSVLPNLQHRSQSILTINNLPYLIAYSVADTLDTTIIYKRNNNTWQLVNALPFRLNAFANMDTLFYNYEDSSQVFHWFYTTNLVSSIAYVQDTFWNRLYNVYRCKNRFIGAYQFKSLYQSANGTNWTKLPDLPNNEKLSGYFSANNILIAQGKVLNTEKNYTYDFTLNKWKYLDVKYALLYAIAEFNNHKYYATNYGLYRTSNDSVFSYSMKGIYNPSLLWMNTVGNSIYVKTRDTVFFSINNGNDWKVSPHFQSENFEQKFFPINNKIYSFSKNKVYISIDNASTWESFQMPDSNLNYVEYKGFDDTSIYLHGQHKITQKEVYMRTSDGINFEVLNMKIDGQEIHPSAIFEDRDTLFAIGPLSYEFYYSLNRGSTWMEYFTQIPVSDQYFVDNFFKYLDRVYVYSIGFNMANDIPLARFNSQWKELDLYPGDVDQSKIFVYNNEIYTLRADRLLQYSLDTFKTFKNSSFRINFLPGYKAKLFAMIGRRVFVELANNGIWTNIIDAPLGIESQDDFNLLVYPNPANSLLNITLPNSMIGEVNFKMYTLHSQLVLQGKFPMLEFNDSIVNIDISTTPNGLYILEIESNSKKYHAKVLINH